MQKIVLLFATKLLDAARITTTNELVSQQDEVTSNHLVMLSNETSGFTQLQQLNSPKRQVYMYVGGKLHSIDIFKLFHSIVASRVGEFCCS